ncbi:MAG: hypothetical protein AB9856_14475 [Cellulosilyticaceae bacterium]
METILLYGFILLIVVVSSVFVYKYTTPASENSSNTVRMDVTSLKKPEDGLETVTKNGEVRTIHLKSFSWTTLFFGFFVPLFRSDWKWALIIFLIGIITCGLGNIYFAFNYNNIHKNELHRLGFK